MQRIIWYIRQLFPLTYRTQYWREDREHFCVWRMWFGRCFDINDVVVAEWDRHFNEGTACGPITAA